MKNENLDFTLTFRNLSKVLLKEKNDFFKKNINNTKEFNNWFAYWKKRLQQENYQKVNVAEKMIKVNPIYIPRNHLIESAIESGLKNNFSKMKELLKHIKDPFKEQKMNIKLALPPKPNEVVTNTFCGT